MYNTKECKMKAREHKNLLMTAVRDRLRRTLRPLQILHHIFNSADLNSPPLSKAQASIPTHHAVIPSNLRHTLNNLAIIHQLRNHTRRRLTSQSAEVNSGLGVALALTHAARARLQRDDVAGASEGVDLGICGGQGTACEGAVLCGDSGCHGVIAGVNCDGVGGTLGVGVLGDHLGEGEALG